jgi:prepilin-type N-terminal cleavage/methylation domain-containing protein
MPGYNSRTDKGFTLVELLIVVAILSVLMGLVFPQLMRGRREALKAACMSNLKSLHAMALMYANEEKVFPFAGSMMTSATAADHLQLLVDYAPKDRLKPELFTCPASKEKPAKEEDPVTHAYHLDEKSLSYAWMSEEATPDAGSNKLLSADKSLNNHAGEGVNVVYFDGAVKWIKAEGAITWEQITGNQLTR